MSNSVKASRAGATYRTVPVTVQSRSPLRFSASGQAGEVVKIPVRVTHAFKGCRFEAADDHKGRGTHVEGLTVDGRDQMPPGAALLTASIAPEVKNNLLSLDECPAGGQIAIFVRFRLAGTWHGTLRLRAPGKDSQYVDGAAIISQMMRPALRAQLTKRNEKRNAPLVDLMPIETETSGCRTCPLASGKGRVSVCLHPAIDSRQRCADWLPAWCPLRERPLTIRLARRAEGK